MRRAHLQRVHLHERKLQQTLLRVVRPVLPLKPRLARPRRRLVVAHVCALVTRARADVVHVQAAVIDGQAELARASEAKVLERRRHEGLLPRARLLRPHVQRRVARRLCERVVEVRVHRKPVSVRQEADPGVHREETVVYGDHRAFALAYTANAPDEVVRLHVAGIDASVSAAE